MTPLRLLLVSSTAAALVSCGNQQTAQENYDTPASPYGAAGYGDVSPYQPVDPVYDAPAAYEETSPTQVPYDVPGAAQPGVGGSVAGPTTVHTVVKGDTLWDISRKYSVSIDAIKQANGMTNDTVILGKRLQIPGQ